MGIAVTVDAFVSVDEKLRNLSRQSLLHTYTPVNMNASLNGHRIHIHRSVGGDIQALLNAVPESGQRVAFCCVYYYIYTCTSSPE